MDCNYSFCFHILDLNMNEWVGPDEMTYGSGAE